MPLDPQARALLDLAAAQGAPPTWTLAPAEARALMRAGAAVLGPGEPVARVDDRAIPGPGGPIPLRIYDSGGDGPRPALVFFHGGGWVVGDLDTHDHLCRAIAVAASAVVVAVDYRLAPEHKFPAAIDDAFAATLWTFAHARELGIDPGRIGVGGDSAGGNLATVVALMARDRGAPPVAHQVLIYPITDCDFDTPSYLENSEGYGLSRGGMIWFWQQYLEGLAAASSPLAAPLRAEDLSGLPPTLILTAQYDVLRDEAESYAARLRLANVPVTLIRHEGMIHGFARRLDILDAARTALAQVASAIGRGGPPELTRGMA